MKPARLARRGVAESPLRLQFNSFFKQECDGGAVAGKAGCGGRLGGDLTVICLPILQEQLCQQFISQTLYLYTRKSWSSRSRNSTRSGTRCGQASL